MDTLADNQSFFSQLQQKHGRPWSNITSGTSEAEKTRSLLEGIVAGEAPDECSVVVFGSVARNEMTKGSDVDWTLLIDGPADPRHRTISQEIKNKIAREFNPPDAEGAFGGMAFSHDIIHKIGGQDDTNDNITKRILLLSESRAIGNSIAYDRVLLNILHRYMEDDISISKSSSKKRFNLPRFLLNDVVRYWRTMAVDYAHKRRVKGKQGWATRNIKLRFSRKLIFVSGLLSCFSCHLFPKIDIPEAVFGTKEVRGLLVSHLIQYVSMTPLEVLCETLLKCAADATAVSALDSYDAFLGYLGDEAARKHLDSLTAGDAEDDSLFQEIHEMSHEFQNALTRLFFHDNDELKELTVKYGVF